MVDTAGAMNVGITPNGVPKRLSDVNPTMNTSNNMSDNNVPLEPLLAGTFTSLTPHLDAMLGMIYDMSHSLHDGSGDGELQKEMMEKVGLS